MNNKKSNKNVNRTLKAKILVYFRFKLSKHEKKSILFLILIYVWVISFSTIGFKVPMTFSYGCLLLIWSRGPATPSISNTFLKHSSVKRQKIFFKKCTIITFLEMTFVSKGSKSLIRVKCIFWAERLLPLAQVRMIFVVFDKTYIFFVFKY